MRRRLADRDQGFSLIELLVSTALFSLVMIVVVSVIITATTTQRTVSSVSSSASTGQLVTRSMQDGISNSATPLSVTASGSDVLIKARTAGKASTLSWSCTAWYYSDADHTIRTTSSSNAIGTVTATSQQSWTLLASNVRMIGTTPVFAAVGTTGVAVSFTVDASPMKPVAFVTTFTSQTTVVGSSPCY